MRNQSLQLQSSRHLVDNLARRAVLGLAQKEELVYILQVENFKGQEKITGSLGILVQWPRGNGLRISGGP